MSIVFQPRIEIKEKHLYVLAVLTLLIAGSVFLASAQAGQGKGLSLSPEEIRDKLEKEIPAAWKAQPQGQQGQGQGQGQGEGGTGATNIPQATHSASGVKVVFQGEVITLQQALNSLEKRTEEKTSRKSRGIGVEGIKYFQNPPRTKVLHRSGSTTVDVRDFDRISNDAKMLLVQAEFNQYPSMAHGGSGGHLTVRPNSSYSGIKIGKGETRRNRAPTTHGYEVTYTAYSSAFNVWLPLDDGKFQMSIGGWGASGSARILAEWK